MSNSRRDRRSGEWLIYSDDNPEPLGEGEARVALGSGNHVTVDAGIASLVAALRQAGIETLWSCEGGPGHMCARPTILAAVRRDIEIELRVIEGVLNSQGIEDYWISPVHAYGRLPNLGCCNAHGGPLTWLIELPGHSDFLAVPVALSPDYTNTNPS